MTNAMWRLGCRRVEKIPNCIDIRNESDVTISADPNNCLRVLYVGWVIPEKGINDLLKMIAQVDGTILTIVGPIIPQLSGGSSQWIYEAIKELHLEERVRLVGRLETEAARRVYRQYDVFVMPSFRKNEAFPNVILEAMEAGVPIIAIRVHAMPEMLRDGTDGFLVDGGDVEMLADRLRWLKNHPKERRRMGRSARERATLLYSVERVTGMWADLYKRAADSA
jgi:glycosyltransferase involved in cell wall biosynthesis